MTRIIATSCLLICLIVSAQAQSAGKSDANARGRIVGSSILGQNGRAVVHNARRISDDNERYEYLANWCMPPENPFILRLQGYFSATNPVPKDGVAELGGKLESPAMELIRVAKKTDKLDDLFRRVDAIPDSESAHQRRKLSLLALVEIARGRMESAKEYSESFYEFAATSKASLTSRWPELLLLNVASRVPTLKGITKDTIEELREPINKSRSSDIGVHLQAILSRASFGESEPMNHWHASTRATAVSRGSGHPNSQWHRSGTTVRCLVSHESDYLHYQIPLTGDFSVEAETSLTGYEHGNIFVGGQWTQVSAGHGKQHGDYRTNFGYKRFEPKLSKATGWLRYRTAVRGNQVVTLVNGREIDRRQITYSPWLAIRNTPGTRGTIRDLRVLGQPTIPDTVYPLLEGVSAWNSYQFSDDQQWEISDEHAHGLLIGQREENTGIARVESLSHYHRPIVEDGEIQYEFFYKDGQHAAHPALERLAFLLGPDGVRLHWVNDGIHQQSLDAQFSEPESKPVTGPLVLKQNDWNHVRMTFQGNQMQLAVNDADVFQHKMIQGQRRLGLYYVSSESTLKVRNMQWRGDWPKKLPDPMQQELAGEQPECLVGLEDMQEFARIQFNQSINFNRFSELAKKVTRSSSPAGLRIEPDVTSGWNAYRLADTKSIHGDFDSTLRFSELTGSNQLGTANLSLRFDDENGNRYGASMAFTPKGERMVGLKYSLPDKNGNNTYRSIQTGDDATRGTLRLVRRDDTLHSLIAYGDSDRFRLVASGKVLDPTAPLNLRLEVSRSKSAKVSVVLHELVIRSSPPGSGNRDSRVNALDRIARTHKPSFAHDFATPIDNDLVTATQATATDTGLQLRASQTPASVTCRHQTSGDFDVQIAVSELDLSAESSLAMKLDVGDDPTQVELAVQRGSDGDYDVIARSKTPDGETNEIGSFSLSSVKTLQMMRIQKTIFFVCKSKTKSRVIGFCDVGLGSIRPGSLQLLLRSESTPATAQLTSLQIRSSKP